MAEIITKRKLSENEIDDLVTQQLSCVLASISKEFMTFDIRDELLRKKEVEISTPEVSDSMQRLCESGSLEIKISNPKIFTAYGANYESRLLVIQCDVEVTQKTKKEA